ncbi:MAG: metalloregulator ArsR/SmtB family transcription factor [Candidatus Promineifilaceae bacterium]|nr:metalloregulator ArsR/SmtB family transcription factor [Candidatus Promineifilaceae bacterium]
MPAAVQTIIDPQTNIIEVALEPANNALHSLMLLIKAEKLTGLDPWVGRTIAALSATEYQTHRLVMLGLHYAVYPERSWSSFPAYLSHLENADPIYLRDRMLDMYLNMPCQGVETAQYETMEDVLRSAEDYLTFLTNRFGSELVDEELEKQAYTYAVNPTALKLLVVSHLRSMWEQHLAAEWSRVKPMLQASVEAFQAIDLNGMQRIEAAEFVTGHSLSGKSWAKWLEKAERVVFMPSAHVGPYFGQFKQGETLGLVFGARLPEGTNITAPDLSRQEIVVRLSALADDTRLRILRLVFEHGEHSSQDIMHELDLSQSATSRHLKQLSANGYLIERRCEGAKCYSLNEERIHDTLRAIALFLTGEP